ncbi:MAG: NfeD family protein [Clostridia bacterium]|nr:NfeD family protein [Clostridia bacterium]
MLWVWGVITAVALVLEFITADLITIWFAAGGLVSLLLTAIFPELPVIWQCVIFVATSCILLLFTRRIFKKLNKTEEKTNIDSLIGTSFKIENVNKESNYAYHKIADVEWRVVAENDEKLVDGAIVEIVKISGNKLVVKTVKKEKNKELKGE